MDWGKEAESTGQTYPAGTYKVVIDRWERVTAKTGTPQIRWYASIQMPEKYLGKFIVDHTPLTEKALWRCAILVKACGIDVNKLGKMDTNGSAFAKVLDSCKGRAAYWRLTIEPDLNGIERNRIDDYQPDTEQAAAGKEEDYEPEFLKE
jgi:hypothetical protein